MQMLYVILLTVSLTALGGGFYLYKKANSIKIQRTQENKRVQQELKRVQSEAQQEKVQLEKVKEEVRWQYKKLNQVRQQGESWVNESKKIVEEDVQKFKTLSVESAENYFNQLERAYSKTQEEFDAKVEEISKARSQIQKQIAQIRESFSAAAARQLKDREAREKIKFYKLSLTPAQEKDILAIEAFKTQLSNPLVMSKLIWSNFFQKQTTDLCNRILGGSKVSGVYKLTNLITEQVYIGQSVDVSRRWKDHVKAGLGIGGSMTNQLYQSMRKDGVWNFSFELIEQVDKDRLNSREQFWIETYQTDLYGLNSTKGNN